MRTSASLASDLRKLLPQFALIAASPLFFGLLAAPPIDWLPPAGGATEVLGALLAAQAAIAALSLAVVLFALERVSARPDADDRIFEEYVRRSWMRPLFLGGLVAVASTGSVLVAGELADQGAPIAEAAPGLRNFIVLAGAAFFASVALPAVLFDRAVRLARPGAWRDLRRKVNEQNVRDAVRVFLARQERLQRRDFGDGENGFIAELSRDLGEGSADEAIRAVLEDAGRAIDERRYADFRRSLDSVEQLVKYAMVELSKQGWQWDEPGSEATWPPLAELDWNLYPLREAVVRRGDREHADELASLDRQLVWLGMVRGCGELFSTALQGWDSNYDLAARIGNREFRELFRRRASRDLDIVLQHLGDRDPAYLADAVRHHATILFLALERGHTDDFHWLLSEFGVNWANAKTLWSYSGERRPGDADIQDIEWMHRYIIMGLAGCSMMLAQRGRMADAQPYNQAARSVFSSVERLTHDFALAKDSDWGLMFLWRNPEMVESGSPGLDRVGPGHYAIRFFSLRLLELATDPMPSLDLGREARPIHRWFEGNAEQVEQYVRVDGGLSILERRELALGALRDAEGRYEETRDAPS